MAFSIAVIKTNVNSARIMFLWHWDILRPLKLFWICVFWVTQSSLPCNYRLMIFTYVLVLTWSPLLHLCLTCLIKIINLKKKKKKKDDGQQITVIYTHIYPTLFSTHVSFWSRVFWNNKVEFSWVMAVEWEELNLNICYKFKCIFATY